MKLPWLATLVVTAAVGTMIGLGIWQIDRAAWKEDLLARYARAQHLPEVAWQQAPRDPQPYLFRRASGLCLQVTSWRAIAGRNLKDQPGWAHIAACRTGAEGPGMQVDVGWSLSSKAPSWRGGPVHGMIAPDSHYRMRLVADRPAPGLEPSQPPSLNSIPNNHMAYAFQWFAFAATALVIYALALRKRLRQAGGKLPPES